MEPLSVASWRQAEGWKTTLECTSPQIKGWIIEVVTIDVSLWNSLWSIISLLLLLWSYFISRKIISASHCKIWSPSIVIWFPSIEMVINGGALNQAGYQLHRPAELLILSPTRFPRGDSTASVRVDAKIWEYFRISIDSSYPSEISTPSSCGAADIIPT